MCVVIVAKRGNCGLVLLVNRIFGVPVVRSGFVVIVEWCVSLNLLVVVWVFVMHHRIGKGRIVRFIIGVWSVGGNRNVWCVLSRRA